MAFLCGEENGTALDAFRTEHADRCQPPSICNAAYNYNFHLFYHLSTVAADATDIFCIYVTNLLQIGYSLSASTTA